MNELRKGMQVLVGPNQTLGTIERIEGNRFVVNGQTYTQDMIDRVEGNRLFLTGVPGDNYQTATGYAQNTNEIRVPVAEEQLNVAKRQGQVGEVQIHKQVREEQVNVPVELRHEEVNVRAEDITDRPLQPGEERAAFQEGTIRVPVYGEEAVVNKEARVTGEVRINKEVQAQQQQVSDTVRREEVTLDRNVDQSRLQGQTGYATTGTGTTQNYNFDRSRLTKDAEVFGSDNQRIGRVKNVSGNSILVDRTAKRDLYVPFNAVQSADGGRLVLNVPASDADNQGWSNPPLTGDDNTNSARY